MLATHGGGEAILRLGLSVVAGGVIGANRERRGEIAGLRTMILVSLGASLSMLLGQHLRLGPGGDPSNLGRIAQGILAGMGFLGAGAIFRHNDLVRGVTTAASLWFITVVGLCLGAGYFGGAAIAWLLAVLVVFLLPRLERRVRPERYACLTVSGRAEAIDELALQRRVEAAGLTVAQLNLTHDVAERTKTLRWEVHYRVDRKLSVPVQIVNELAREPGISEVVWS